MLSFLYWQFISAPTWLLKLYANLELALWRFFSVPFIVKTLFSYWHKDSVTLRQGSFTGLVKAISWNIISRAVGFIIRVTVLLAWCGAQAAFIILASSSFLIFILWPVISLSLIAYGAYLLTL
ncbi:MAG: hypothetical protein Q8P73_01950 [bacterium]|nr:hypothetical protein [bacterium]